ncbi:hypothetical protein V496_05958 [Pseudogymnoascus sp. VKM F-4515 (FW-2607)]|nr:hypothetical protein V496_05958 [Pseudogymnoascus sp. VKM F-4515 (FW-2607)]KFY90390.1 hypothetical protein V498_05984 [Pseudogymnoascus sp. VKM F-4517 (FW-2822)]
MASGSASSSSDDGSDEDVYIVKRILAEGGTDEDRVFLIEWEGYDIEESTWEPEDNVLSKDTLKAWDDEKLRQREGLSQPLDTDEFERRQEKYANRKRKREKLGLPPLSESQASESEEDSSSDEAEEAYTGVPDYEGIPSPKKSQQARVKHHDRTFRDDDTVMHDAFDRAEARVAERPRAPKSAKEPSTSEDRNRKETKTKVQKAPVIEAPSATGYQGTAHRGPVSRSTAIPKGRSVRGGMRMMGAGGHMAKSKPKAPRTIENRILTETHSEAKAPQYFATKSMERKFELGARALADRPPAKLPFLMNPADYINHSRIRKKGSAPVPGVAAMAPMVSSPEQLSPREEASTAGVWGGSGDQETEKSHKPPTGRKVSFAVEGIDRDQAEQPNPSPVAAFHPPTAPMGSTSATPIRDHRASSGAQDTANGPPSAPVRKVSLANYAAKHSSIPSRPVSMFDQGQGGLNETTLKSFIGDRQPQNDPIMLTFIDVNVHNPAWGTALQQLQSKGPAFDHICRSTDVDNYKSEFNPTLLARGTVTVATGGDDKAQEIIATLADHLRVNISGLLYNLESLNVIVYPTRCEEWKFIESGVQLQHSGQLSFFSFTTPSKIVCLPYNREAESRMCKMRVEGYDDYHLLNRAMFGFSYQSLHQVDKKSPRDSFFLLLPNMVAPIAEHTAAWLRSSNKECRIYTCQEPGSWHQFMRCTANPEGGSLIIHQKMIPFIPRYPRLQDFLLNGLNNVWCIDEDFPRGRYLLRLFPHGGAVCLTSGFLSGEPEMALLFLNWFLPKRGGSRASTGTWKLLVCHDVYKFVSGQAFGAAKRRAKLLDSLPPTLTDSQKDTLARESGLSMKSCQDRLDLMDVIGKLVRPKNERERDLDAVLQADDARSLMVFANEDIKPSDDCALIRYFAYWSMLHLKDFRRFVAIGSKATPEDYEDVVAQAPEKSNSSGIRPLSENTPQGGPPFKIPKKAKWNRNAFASVDGANDDDEVEAGELNDDVAPEDSDSEATYVNMDPGILRFIVDTGAKYNEAAEFMRRAQGNHDIAIKLHKSCEDAKMKGKEAAEKAVKTPPDPPSPHATEANAAIPSTEAVTTEDVVMEDAPPTPPEAAPPGSPPTNANTPVQSNVSDAQPTSSQTSNAGIVTSENGTRLVPRSVRMSGTVRNEVNIRPGYVPPEDKEVYKVRRDRSGSVGRASMPRSRSGSRGTDEKGSNGAASVSPGVSRSGSRGAEEEKGSDGAASVSPPGGVLTPVTPATPRGRQRDRMEGVEGAQEEKGERKPNTLEWYAERKLKGEEWSHIAVVGWEEAFKLLRVEYKKK